MIAGADYEVRTTGKGTYTMRRVDTTEYKQVPAPYIVTRNSCTCPQFQRRGVVCKHMLEVQKMEKQNASGS